MKISTNSILQILQFLNIHSLNASRPTTRLVRSAGRILLNFSKQAKKKSKQFLETADSLWSLCYDWYVINHSKITHYEIELNHPIENEKQIKIIVLNRWEFVTARKHFFLHTSR